jgi:glycosyltransferase involved in cell wall biosynthesis
VSQYPGYKRSELRVIAKQLDYVIVPSLWWETFNLVAFELAYLGLPIIHSDDIGMAEYLDKKLEFSSNDPEDLRRVLKLIIEKTEEEIEGIVAKRQSLPTIKQMVDSLM